MNKSLRETEIEFLRYEEDKINHNADLYKRYGKPIFWRWLINILADWIVVIGVYWLMSWSNNNVSYWLLPGIYFIAILVIGNRQHAISVMGHEGTHRLASQIRWFNDFVTDFFCWWPLGTGFKRFRLFHMEHHRYLGTELDPEYGKKVISDPIFDIPKTKGQIVRRFLLGLIGFHGGWKELFAAIWDFRPITFYENIGLWLWRGAVFLILWQLQIWWWAIPLWFIAQGTAFWSMFRLRLWTEHVGTSETHRVWVPLWQRILYLPHYVWLHWEHHQWDFIPFWNLPKVRLLNQSVKIIPVGEVLDSYATSHFYKTGIVRETLV